MSKKLILGSTSIYRKELLTKLGIPFEAIKPSCDEENLKKQLLSVNKTPTQIAEALSVAKANSLHVKFPNDVIIGGDQMVDFDGQIIGKSKNFEKAKEQLSAMSGRTHQLITSVALIYDDKKHILNHVSKMKMKKLTVHEIENYLHKDVPFDCSGSYKIEQSGIALFEKIECDDFSAIQGLPLMWISQKLKEIGYELFAVR